MLCDLALAQSPDAPDALFVAGVIARESGDAAAAVERLERAVALRPDDAATLDALGSALRLADRPEHARSCFSRALVLEPGFDTARFNRAVTALAVGDVPAALSDLLVLIRRRPTDAEVFDALGRALAAQERLTEAAAAFAQASKLAPNRAGIWTGLAGVQQRLGDAAGARRSLDAALRLAPEDASAHVRSGWLCSFMGDVAGAEAAFRAALERAPDLPAAAAGLAHLEERRGAVASAAERLRPLLDSADPRVALTWAEVCRQQGRPADAVEVVERALPAAGADAGRLWFALGHLRDETGDTDAAFAAFTSGNRAHGLSFDAGAHSQAIDRLIAATADLRDWPRSSARSERPVFIIGMPRSGTSLVEQILASHRDVHGAGELDTVMRVAATMAPGGDWPQVLRGIAAQRRDAFARAYLEQLATLHPSAARITDKMPLNYLYMGMITCLWPGAKIIHCVRDALDTCLSCFLQPFMGPHYAFSNDLSGLGRYWRDYHRLMEHQARHVEMLTVPYGELVTDPERWSRALVELVGLPWDPACLSPHTHSRTVETASYAQVRRPIYRSSVGRAQRYAAHLEPLRAALRDSNL